MKIQIIGGKVCLRLIYVRGSGGVGVPSSPISDRVVDDVRSYENRDGL